MVLEKKIISILSFLRVCRRGFVRSVDVLENAKDEFGEQLFVGQLIDEGGRLVAWARDWGAFRDPGGRVPLDYNLQYLPFIHDKITELLQELNSALRDGAWISVVPPECL
jgi:hypothetical protein